VEVGITMYVSSVSHISEVNMVSADCDAWVRFSERHTSSIYVYRFELLITCCLLFYALQRRREVWRLIIAWFAVDTSIRWIALMFAQMFVISDKGWSAHRTSYVIFLCLRHRWPVSEALCFHVVTPSVRPCMRHPLRPFCCFRDIDSKHWWIFTKLLFVVHLARRMNCLGFDVKKSKVKFPAWPNMWKIPFSWFVSAISLVCINVVQLGTKVNWLVLRSKVKGQGHSTNKYGKNVLSGVVQGEHTGLNAMHWVLH